MAFRMSRHGMDFSNFGLRLFSKNSHSATSRERALAADCVRYGDFRNTYPKKARGSQFPKHHRPEGTDCD
jgi:hypothetical protein